MQRELSGKIHLRVSGHSQHYLPSHIALGMKVFHPTLIFLILTLVAVVMSASIAPPITDVEVRAWNQSLESPMTGRDNPPPDYQVIGFMYTDGDCKNVFSQVGREKRTGELYPVDQRVDYRSILLYRGWKAYIYTSANCKGFHWPALGDHCTKFGPGPYHNPIKCISWTEQ